MPKIKQTSNRVIVHVGNFWQRYHSASRNTKPLWQFRIKDVGRASHSELILCKPPRSSGWHAYAWSFSNQQVKRANRKLVVYDRKAFEILQRLKKSGNLRGWNLVFRKGD